MINRTTTSDRRDVCEEIWSDTSDYYCSDDESSESKKSTSVVQPEALRCPLVGNTALLSDLSGHVSPVWKKVGRHLPIKESIIENIDIDYRGEGEKEKAYQLLLTWSRQHGSRANLQQLLDVLAYIGESQIVNGICADFKRPWPSVAGSGVSKRAMELETKSHVKLQKKVLRKLADALQFYQQRLKEVEDLQRRHFEETDAIEMKRKLQKLDKTLVQNKLDSLQQQVYNMQEKEQKYFELDQQLRFVADKLYELDKTFKQFNDTLDELRVSYYTQVECSFVGLCRFTHIKFPRGSSSVKQEISSKQDEDLEDDVFQDSPSHDPREIEAKASPHSRLGFARNNLSRSSLTKLFRQRVHRNKTSPNTYARRSQEEHTKQKLSVSIDIDEQFQLQDFVKKFCHRYRQNRPFIYSHCCMNMGLQERISGSQVNLPPPTPTLSPIDLNTLPIPRSQSSETIKLLVTSPFGIRASRGKWNSHGERREGGVGLELAQQYMVEKHRDSLKFDSNERWRHVHFTGMRHCMYQTKWLKKDEKKNT